MVGWPDALRTRQLRERVSNWCAGLEKERQKWLSEWEAERAEHAKQVQAWEAAVSRAVQQKELSEAAAADAQALAKLLSAEGMSDDVLPVPENFSKALEHLQAVRRERAQLGLLRRREIELLESAEPLKALELSSEPEKPAGREQIDKLFADPELRALAAWDWRIELLDPARAQQVQNVHRLEQTAPWRSCSRCRWQTGCLSCDARKALRYHLIKQGYVGAGLWPIKQDGET